MPSLAGAVGGVELPVPAGKINEKFEDPLVEALLSFAAWYIKQAIDDKLEKITGTSHDAVPEANRFSFDPLEPRGHQIKLPHPALFVYWSGKSQWADQTVLYATRMREIQFLYVYDELAGIKDMNRRIGIFNAVDAAMFQMTKRQVAAEFTYGDNPEGMWINTSLGDLNTIEWDWMGGTPGRFGIDEGPLASRRAAKKSGIDYPALMGMWMVDERVALSTLEDPEDVMPDMLMTINSSDGETSDTVEFMQRYLTAPDGSGKL